MSNFNIQVVSDICGISDHTLRAWERRYGVVEPLRSDGGQRLYTQKDLDKLQLLAFLVSQGHRISKLAKLEDSELRVLYHGLNNQAPKIQKVATKSINLIFKLLKEYRLDDLYYELIRLKQELGDLPFIDRILLPLFREVGQKVANGQYSITQEHAISALSRDLLSQVQLTPPSPHTPKLVLTTPEGNLHELGLLMANVYCRHFRINSHYFGINLPAQPLAEAINTIKAEYVILGSTYSDDWQEKNLIDYLQKLDVFLNVKTTIFLSGLYKKLDPLSLVNIKIDYMNTFDDLKTWLLEKSKPTL